MTSYLVDTNVISELAPGKAPPRQILDWLAACEPDLFLSVITPLEILTGILKLGRQSPGRRHQAMLTWYQGLEINFSDRMLPVSRDVTGFAAQIADAHAARGLAPEWPDVIIAATARAHSMTLLTRNIRHFQAAGIPIIDPFTTLPE